MASSNMYNNREFDYHNLNENTLYKETLINGIPPKAVNIPRTIIGIDDDGNIYEKQYESYAYEIIGD